MIDVTHQINAVRRSVGTRVLEAGEARVVTISQSYDTDAEDLGTRVPTSSAFRDGSSRSPATSASVASTDSRATPTAPF